MLAARRPEHYGALSLDVNNLDDFSALWGLPPPGALDVYGMLPDTAQPILPVLENLLARRAGAETPGLAIFPAHTPPLTARQLSKLGAHGIAVAGPLARPARGGRGRRGYSTAPITGCPRGKP